MQLLKRGLMAAGALALAAMLLNIVAPKAAHAIVATAVQVMNTSATPVPNRDVDAAGRNALVLSCTQTGTSICATPQIPPNYTFVLDSINVSVLNNGYPWVAMTVVHGGATHLFYVPLSPTSGVNGGDGGVVATNFTTYADSATSLGFIYAPRGSSPPPAIQGIFSGHLVPSATP
jgi:hypothetical protein